MGCCASKDNAPKVYDPTPDPVTGLTQQDRELIVATWAVVGNRNVLKKNALDFFIMLFGTYPDIQNYFGLFKGKDLTQLRESPKMRVHAASVFYFINSYVENIDDSETLVGLVEKMALGHIARGIGAEEFEKLRLVFQKFLPSVAGDKCTPEVAEAWDKLLKAQTAIFIMLAEEGSSDGEGSGQGDSGSG